MYRKVRQLGQVNLVQLQPNGLIIETPDKTPTGYFYDTSRLVQVDRLVITPLGIEATIPGGEHVLDIHHINHPDKAYDDDDLVCVGFTSHYDAMRAHFGEHMVNGIAGENIIIEYSEEIWPDDLSQQLGIENQDTGEMAILEMVSFAAPCVEFSQFCAKSQYERIAADQLKEILQFLGNGRRGFLLVLSKMHDVITVRPDDKVFVVAAESQN
jgi:hypothetical protein